MNIIQALQSRIGGKAPEYTPDVPENGQESNVGKAAPVMDAKRLREAKDILQKYKDGKSNLEKRIIENEQWWKLRHWDYMQKQKNDKRPQPASAWLFNSIANKHADAMDNYPEPAVLPREEGDKQTAETLSEVLPVVLEYNDFEDTYSSAWWYKLKAGTSVYGVFWNSKLNDGIGDVDIKECDILNLYWQPGIKDIQQSRNIFNVALIDDDVLLEQYPEELKGKTLGKGIDTTKFIYDDTVDTSKKSAVIDWYYKKRVGNRDVLHFCKFCNDTVLYSSEDDPNLAQKGFYDHGEYPFIFDALFVTEGSPCGYGYIDMMKDTQGYIDRLQQVELEHCVNLQRKRFFVPQNVGINEEEFLDWTNPLVHYTGSIDKISEIKVDPLENTVSALLQMKIDELKETSGNRDFSQGGTTSGVTAASAIAALQEAGSKLSRDMLKSSYRAFTKVCRLTIELIRQFYDIQRCFRVTGNSGTEFVMLDNSALNPDATDGRKPIFDIDVSAQRQSPFSKLSQNELAKEMYNMGFFNPELCDQALAALDMMNFDNKEEVVQRISENGTLAQKLMQTQQTALKLAQIVDATNGSNIAQGIAAEIDGGNSMTPVSYAGASGSGGGVDLTASASPTEAIQAVGV